jgi:two-component system nitrogen regulation response regulator NtrX
VGAAHFEFLAPAAGSAASSEEAPPGDLASSMERHERELVLAALERHRWRMTKTADALGLERSHLYKKLKALGIEKPVED